MVPRHESTILLVAHTALLCNNYFLSPFVASCMASPAFSTCWPTFSAALFDFLAGALCRAFLLLAAPKSNNQRTHDHGRADGLSRFHHVDPLLSFIGSRGKGRAGPLSPRWYYKQRPRRTRPLAQVHRTSIIILSC